MFIRWHSIHKLPILLVSLAYLTFRERAREELVSKTSQFK